MARKKKFPKQPKAGSSLAVWERYENRVKAVAEYNKKLAEAPKKKQTIKDRVSKLKAKY